MKQRIILIALLCLVATAMPAQKNTINDLKKQQEKTLRELQETEKLLGETKKSEKATINKLNLLNKDIEQRRRLMQSINSEIVALDEEMNQLSLEKKELQDELEVLQADYARMVRLTHYHDMQQSPLLFILSADDFNQTVRRIRYLRQFQQYRKQQVADICQKQADIDIHNELLEENRQEQVTTLTLQQKEQEKLRRSEQQQQKMLKDLKSKEKTLKAQQKKQQQKANELNKKIEDLIRQQADSQKKKNGGKLTKEQELVSGGFAANKGRLPWPVERGVVTGEYGVHPHPTLEQVTVNNKGLYISTSQGASCRAIYEGEVTSVFSLSGTNAVIVQHGDYRSVYSGLKTVQVKKGDKVQTKQAIGTIYTDPENDNKTELFFQIWKDKEILNPSNWIAR